MNHEGNLELLTRLGRVDSVGADVMASAEATIRDAALADQWAAWSDTPDHRKHSARRNGVRPLQSQRRIWTRGLSVAAAVVVIAGVSTAVLQPGSPAGPAPAAATTLHELAAVAAAQPPSTVPGPGQFLYTESQEAYTSSTVTSSSTSYTVQVPEVRQIWIGSDGSGRLVESFGNPVFLNAADRAAWVSAGSPSLAEGSTDESFGPGGLSDGPTNLATLPTDPATLLKEISARQIEGGPPGTAEDFSQIGDLLRESDASPALRSALYQVAADLPGIVVDPDGHDHDGRSGISVSLVATGIRHEMIFDPTTSALLGEQDTVVGDSPSSDPLGTVEDWVVYLSSGVVSATSTVVPGAPAPSLPSP